MSGPEERQRVVDLYFTTPMTTAQVVRHLGYPTRQCLERWLAKDSRYAGRMAKPIIRGGDVFLDFPTGRRPPYDEVRQEAARQGGGPVRHIRTKRCGHDPGARLPPAGVRCGCGTRTDSSRSSSANAASRAPPWTGSSACPTTTWSGTGVRESRRSPARASSGADMSSVFVT